MGSSPRGCSLWTWSSQRPGDVSVSFCTGSELEFIAVATNEARDTQVCVCILLCSLQALDLKLLVPLVLSILQRDAVIKSSGGQSWVDGWPAATVVSQLCLCSVQHLLATGLFKFQLILIKQQITSASEADQPNFKCSVVVSSWWLPYQTALIGSLPTVTGPCRRARLSLANEKKL